MEVKKIYFDMDGVLADFDRGIKEIIGMTPMPQDSTTDEYDAKLWQGVRDAGHYYNMLKPMQDAELLVSRIYAIHGEKCGILSGVPKPDKGVTTSREDKENWMKKYFPEIKDINLVLKADKPKFCTGIDCILIDDLQKNIDAWEAAGGTGILHKNAEDTLAQLEKLGVI